MHPPAQTLTHAWIWAAIDQLAHRHNLSPSGLARLAGLDPTAFNRSKRTTAEGRLRWPSTESIAKILEATGTSLSDFADQQIAAPLANGQNAPANQPRRSVTSDVAVATVQPAQSEPDLAPANTARVVAR